MYNLSNAALAGNLPSDDFAVAALDAGSVPPEVGNPNSWSATEVAADSEERKSARLRSISLQSITQFGPGCRPMFYTALPKPTALAGMVSDSECRRMCCYTWKTLKPARVYGAHQRWIVMVSGGKYRN